MNAGGPRATLLVAALALIATTCTPPATPAGRPRETPPPKAPPSVHGPCDPAPDPAPVVADDLLASRYGLPNFPMVALPPDPLWNENPVGDPNWEFNYHALRYVEALWRAWEEKRDRRYLDRYEFLLGDWYRDNPREQPPSRYSWHDHSAAWRGIVYACALHRLPDRPWLREAALLHGRTLAEETFYVHHGNHALNQAIGLLAIGCEVGDRGWQRLATTRIERLLPESVDAEGAINEQAIGYQWYNFVQYSAAAANLRACGLSPSNAFDLRLSRMHSLIAFGALPNGEWELIGDTDSTAPYPVPGTVVEYVTSGGTKGVKPARRYAVFDAGFAFFRSGWGETRPLAQETAVSVRFGPPTRAHGHKDATALTLYASGDRILLDPGKYHYISDPMRQWFRSASAHNTIEVIGTPMRGAGAAPLVREQHSAAYDFLAIEHTKIPDVRHARRVLYLREPGILLVEDDVRSRTPRTVRQWWHLHPDARPALDTDGFFTGRAGSSANAWVVQLDGRARQHVERGATSPIQGWVAFEYGKLLPAPAVSVTKSGTRARFFTMIVVSPTAERSWVLRSFRPRPEGADLEIDLGGIVQRIRMRRASVSVTT